MADPKINEGKNRLRMSTKQIIYLYVKAFKAWGSYVQTSIIFIEKTNSFQKKIMILLQGVYRGFFSKRG